jgi:hypothetical protein
MRIHRILISFLFATWLAALPLSGTSAQSVQYPQYPQYPQSGQYYPPCSPFPLFWPFCVVGAAIGAAATIVTLPFWALTGPPAYYYYAPYGRYPPPPYYPPPYYAPGIYPTPNDYGSR